MRRVVLFSLSLGCFAGIATAPQDAPVIQVNTRLVPVDVVVRNGKGPVTDLNKDDFTLFDNGKRQKIALFKVTDPRGQSEPVTPLPPGLVSNRLDESGVAVRNTTAILVDHLNTPQALQSYGDNQVVKFLQMAKPGDRIAIYLVSEGRLQVIQDFTTDLNRLIRAATRLKPDDAKIDSLTRMIEDVAKANPSDPKKYTRPLEEMALGVNENRAAETTKRLRRSRGT
jgi:VWFA-related protein